MELGRLERWKPAARFTPSRNDFLFAAPAGCYARQDKVSLIVHWQHQAEQVAMNAILLMMTGGLK